MNEPTFDFTEEWLDRYAATEAEMKAAQEALRLAEGQRLAARKRLREMEDQVAAAGPYAVRSNSVEDRRGRMGHRYVCYDTRTGRKMDWKGGTIQRKPAEDSALDSNRSWASRTIHDALTSR